jgi:hypothetical protein
MESRLSGRTVAVISSPVGNEKSRIIDGIDNSPSWRGVKTSFLFGKQVQSKRKIRGIGRAKSAVP